MLDQRTCFYTGLSLNQDVFASEIASVRLRTALAIQAAEPNSTIFPEVGSSIPSIFFIGKLPKGLEKVEVDRLFKFVLDGQRQGMKVVLDYSDHKIATRGDLSDVYREFLKISDFFTTSSSYLRRILVQEAQKPVFVVNEPVEVDFYEPRMLKDWTKALWFGHPSNFGYLVDALTRVEFGADLEIRALTDAMMLNKNKVPLNFRVKRTTVRVFPWSLEAMRQATLDSSFAILPSSTQDPLKAGASPNRLVTAIALGLPVLASPIESYREIGYFVDLEKTRQNPRASLEELTKYLPKAQASIEGKFSRTAVKNAWKDVFNKMLTQGY